MQETTNWSYFINYILIADVDRKCQVFEIQLKSYKEVGLNAFSVFFVSSDDSRVASVKSVLRSRRMTETREKVKQRRKKPME